MIKTKFVFAVSMVAMMAVNVANAEIAATSYVDKGVTTATNAANAAQTSANAANTAAGKAQTSANNAQVAADNAQASADAAAASAKTANDAVALKQDKSTAVTHTANTAAGSATVPVYVNANGVATAITSYSGTAAKATADASGNTITTTYEKVANKKGSTYTSGSETEYTSVLAAETIANKAVAASKAQLGALADLDTVSTEYIDDGAVTAAKTTGIYGYIPSGMDKSGTAEIWVE